jgi:hypothetical protein
VLEVRAVKWNIACLGRSRLTRFSPRRRVAIVLCHRPQVESLEVRVLPSTIFWGVDTSGDFNNPANWQGGVVPGAGDIAVINRSVPVTVSLSASDSVGGIQVGNGQTLQLSSGAGLTISGAATNDGTIIQSGSTLALDPGSTLTNQADGTYQLQAGATVTSGTGGSNSFVNLGLLRKVADSTAVNFDPLNFTNSGPWKSMVALSSLRRHSLTKAASPTARGPSTWPGGRSPCRLPR